MLNELVEVLNVAVFLLEYNVGKIWWYNFFTLWRISLIYNMSIILYFAFLVANIQFEFIKLCVLLQTMCVGIVIC